jgi:transposase InsO family protein
MSRCAECVSENIRCWPHRSQVTRINHDGNARKRSASISVRCPVRQIHWARKGRAKGARSLLADLGVTRSHNRPHTSNDNPFSESHFKTLKYQPRFPQRFGSIDDARNFCRRFFDWYNQDHHHAGIGLMTPDQVHFGRVDAVHAARQVTLDRAFAEHPARFVNKAPVPLAKPTATWINRPAPKAVTECRPQP